MGIKTIESWSVKEISIAFGYEDTDGDSFLKASYHESADSLDIWCEFTGLDENVALPKTNSGAITTHLGGDYGMTREAGIALRDFLIYCFPLEK